MDAFWMTLFAAIIGGFLAKAVANRLDRAFRPPPSWEANPVEPFPHRVAIRAAAYLVVVAWAIIFAIFPAALLLALLTRERYVPVYLLLLVGAIVIVLPCYLVIALLLRCPSCHRRILVQSVTNPPHGEPSKSMNAWGRLILRVAFNGRFRCMYCGQQYWTRDPVLEGR
jgi:hypothetical protein